MYRMMIVLVYCQDVVIYTADSRNVHSVDEVISYMAISLFYIFYDLQYIHRFSFWLLTTSILNG